MAAYLETALLTSLLIVFQLPHLALLLLAHYPRQPHYTQKLRYHTSRSPQAYLGLLRRSTAMCLPTLNSPQLPECGSGVGLACGDIEANPGPLVQGVSGDPEISRQNTATPLPNMPTSLLPLVRPSNPTPPSLCSLLPAPHQNPAPPPHSRFSLLPVNAPSCSSHQYLGPPPHSRSSLLPVNAPSPATILNSGYRVPTPLLPTAQRTHPTPQPRLTCSAFTPIHAQSSHCDHLPSTIAHKHRNWRTCNYTLLKPWALWATNIIGCAPPRFDLFSSPTNAVFSPISPPHPVDAFHYDWNTPEPLWCNPPFDFFPRVKEHILQHGAHLLLVVPGWRETLPLVWPLALHHVRLPFQPLFSGPRGTPLPHPKWSVWVLLIILTPGGPRPPPPPPLPSDCFDDPYLTQNPTTNLPSPTTISPNASTSRNTPIPNGRCGNSSSISYFQPTNNATTFIPPARPNPNIQHRFPKPKPKTKTTNRYAKTGPSSLVQTFTRVVPDQPHPTQSSGPTSHSHDKARNANRREHAQKQQGQLRPHQTTLLDLATLSSPLLAHLPITQYSPSIEVHASPPRQSSTPQTRKRGLSDNDTTTTTTDTPEAYPTRPNKRPRRPNPSDIDITLLADRFQMTLSIPDASLQTIRPPGPSRTLHLAAILSTALISVLCSAHYPHFGRGRDLLSCGDIESNPGPTTIRVGPITISQPVTGQPDSQPGMIVDNVPNSDPAPFQDVPEEMDADPAPPPFTALDSMQDTEMLSQTPASSSGHPPPSPLNEPPQPLTSQTILCHRFACPLQCGHQSWATRESVVNHVARVHLPSMTDYSPLGEWLRSANQRICLRCAILVNAKRNCKRCGDGPGTPSSTSATTNQATDTTVDETTWLAILQNAHPVTRTIPLGVRDQWFGSLSEELERCTADSPPEAFLRLQAFCRIMLAPLGRGGKRHCKQAAAVMRSRLNRWAAGQHHPLAQEYLRDVLQTPSGSRESSTDDLLPEPIRRAALRAVNEGALGKAARVLAEKTFSLPPDVVGALQALHPTADCPAIPPNPLPPGDDFTPEEVLACLRKFPPGSAGGTSGLMAAHLPASPTAAYSRAIDSIARLSSDFAWGRLSAEAVAILASARLIPIGKKGNGVRPIAVGELIRRIAGKVLVARYQATVTTELAPYQVGVGSRLGAESIIHKSRAWISQAPPDHVLLQLDFKNAYNTLSREQILKAVAKHCPSFLPYAISCYGNPATLFASGFTIASEEGEHQGCPCGPLFFAVTTLGLARKAHDLSGGWSHWYLDDGYIAGPRTKVNAALDVIEADAKGLGLILNRGKCGLMVRDHMPLPNDIFRDIPRFADDECMAILGAPVGHPTGCKDWVDKNVLDPFRRALERLEGLGDPRAASLILRQCLSACKLTWIMRTTEPQVALWAAEQASPLLRRAWGTILGETLPDAHWRLSTLPIRSGGAGLQDPSDTVHAALLSSWLSAVTQTGPLACTGAPNGLYQVLGHMTTLAPNLGAPLVAALNLNGITAVRQHQLLPQWCTQGAWSDEANHQHATNFDSNVNERLQSLRNLQLAPNAGLWLTAQPQGSPEDPTFSPEEWQLLLKARIGMSCYPPNATCRACRQPMDSLGDHSLTCPSAGLYRRHNRLRDTLFLLAQEAGWAPEREVNLPALTERPADLLCRATFGKPLAIDVSVSHPLRLSSTLATRGEVAAAAEASENRKRAMSQAACERAGWGFRAAGFETTGGLGSGASHTIRQLSRYLSMKRGASAGEVGTSISRAVSLALAKGRGEMLAASCPQ